MAKYTKLSLGLILTLWLLSFFFYRPWQRDNAMGGGDCTGYYMYLPATFLQHDLHDLKQTIYQRDKAAGIPRDSTRAVTDVGEVYFTGNTPVIKYTCGIAILEAPAFFLAHVLSLIAHKPDTGFTKTYIFLVQLWCLLFAFAGLCLLSIILREFFANHDKIIAITVSGIGVSTNLYHFVVYNTCMSHSYLFTLYAILLLSTIRFYKNYTLKYGALVGISAGMIALVRPNEIICLLIPLLYGMPQIAGLKDRIATLFKTKTFYLAIGLFALCAAPQLLYWKTLTGHWVYYSYGAEVFDFKHSKIHGGLFGFKNGWLPYTPIMVFAIAGLIPMFLNRGKTLMATLTFLPLHIYIIYSWWCWTYVNGLGSRPMIETYPLLSIPLASFGYCAIKNKVTAYLWFLAVIFFASQQIMMTYQTSKDILLSEDSNWTFYKSTFFKTHININDVIAFDTDEKQPDKPVFDHTIFINNFEDSLNSNFISNNCGSGKFGFLLDNRIIYSPCFTKTLKECGLHPSDWIKISFHNYSPPPSASLYGYASMNVALLNKSTYKYTSIRIQNKIQPLENCGLWVFPCYTAGNVFFFTQVPKDAMPYDTVRIFGSNNSTSPVVIDNLKIDAFKP